MNFSPKDKLSEPQKKDVEPVDLIIILECIQYVGKTKTKFCIGFFLFVSPDTVVTFDLQNKFGLYIN